jgi:hypothetical protein
MPLDYLNGWLFGINATRIKEALRERVIRYQKECYQILARAFIERRQVDPTPNTAALVQIREIALAIAEMA